MIGVECMCCEIVAKKGNFTPFRGTVMSAEAMVHGSGVKRTTSQKITLKATVLISCLLVLSYTVLGSAADNDVL